MFNFRWWRDKDNREGAEALSNALKVVVPALIAAGAVVLGFFYAQDEVPAPAAGAPSITATTDAQVQTGTGVQVRSGLAELEAAFGREIGR